MRPGHVPPLRAAALAILLSAFSQALGGQELGSWLDSPGSGRYAPVRAQALELAARARAAGIPERLLSERVAEGASKSVPPARLISALRDDVERLVALNSVLSERGLIPAGADDLAALLRKGELMLRAGVAVEAVAAALDRAPAPSGAGGAQARIDRAFAALSTTVALVARYRISPPSQKLLAASIAACSLPPARLESLVSLFARGLASGLSSDRVARTIADALAGGESIDKIERELERRSPQP